MTLQTSGSISLADLASEYTDSPPYSMSEFYRNGGKVPNSVTVNVPAGSYTSQQYRATAPVYWWRAAVLTQIIWNGTVVGPSGAIISSTATSYSYGGYDYARGAFVANVTLGTGKNAFTAPNYKVKRRTSATTSSQSVNQNVPTSGQVSLSQFYGGRKT